MRERKEKEREKGVARLLIAEKSRLQFEKSSLNNVGSNQSEHPQSERESERQKR